MPADETTTAQQFVIDADREHVIAATTAATAELGYPELTIAAIADRAGGPSSAVLAHFPDVDACFLAAYDAAIARLVTSVWTAFEAQLELSADGEPHWTRQQRSLLLACELGVASDRQRARAHRGSQPLAEHGYRTPGGSTFTRLPGGAAPPAATTLEWIARRTG